MKKRKPQKVCKCGHAKSRHWVTSQKANAMCEYCFYNCMGFTQDNLKTLERLYEFNQTKLSL